MAGLLKPLRLGFPDPFPPFCESTATGTQGSMINALTASLPDGQRIEWLPAAIDTLPRWLAEHRIHAIAPKAITAARDAAFTFSQPLLQTDAALFGLTPPPALHAALTARIATPRQGPLAALIVRHAPGARLVTTEDYAATFAAVLSGRADLGALNADAGAELAQRLHKGHFAPPGPRFAALGLAVATLPGDPHKALARLGLRPFIVPQILRGESPSGAGRQSPPTRG